MSPTAPTLDDAKRASAVFAEAQAKRMNADLTHRYMLNFEAWKTEVLAGKRDNKNPPQPPHAWIVEPDAEGYAYETTGKDPVCAMPALPEDHSKTQEELDEETGDNNIDIGVHLSGSYWSAGKNDTCKSGFRTPPMPPGSDYPAGSIFEKVGFFMGKGWWLKIA